MKRYAVVALLLVAGCCPALNLPLYEGHAKGTAATEQNFRVKWLPQLIGDLKDNSNKVNNIKYLQTHARNLKGIKDTAAALNRGAKATAE